MLFLYEDKKTKMRTFFAESSQICFLNKDVPEIAQLFSQHLISLYLTNRRSHIHLLTHTIILRIFIHICLLTCINTLNTHIFCTNIRKIALLQLHSTIRKKRTSFQTYMRKQMSERLKLY